MSELKDFKYCGYDETALNEMIVHYKEQGSERIILELSLLRQENALLQAKVRAAVETLSLISDPTMSPMSSVRLDAEWLREKARETLAELRK